jgi:hypothetical protein
MATASAIAKPEKPFRQYKSPWVGWPSTFFGLIAAILLAEVLLRSIATVNLGIPVDRNWTPSSPETFAMHEQFSEGFALSHFSRDGGRLTGISPVSGAPTIVLLGDSYVEAAQLKDIATIGGVVEKLSRIEGKPVNVRQYGWSGAGPPLYIYMANAVSSLNPERVAVLLNFNDLGSEAFSARFYKFDRNYNIAENPDKPSRIFGVHWLTAHSVLFSLAVERIYELSVHSETHGAASTWNREIPEHEVAALKAAYGSKLVIFYLGADANGNEISNEGYLLEVCKSYEVKCIDLRGPMRSDPHFWRGFDNTTPGLGHLNEYGASKVGQIIWEAVR